MTKQCNKCLMYIEYNCYTWVLLFVCWALTDKKAINAKKYYMQYQKFFEKDNFIDPTKNISISSRPYSSSLILLEQLTRTSWGIFALKFRFYSVICILQIMKNILPCVLFVLGCISCFQYRNVEEECGLLMNKLDEICYFCEKFGQKNLAMQNRSFWIKMSCITLVSNHCCCKLHQFF